MTRCRALLGPALLLLATAARAETLAVAAPADVKAVDTPNDPGNSVTVKWTKLAAEPAGLVYVIERRIAAAGAGAGAAWVKAGEANAGGERYTDAPMTDGHPGLVNGTAYEYRVAARVGEVSAASAASGPAVPAASAFNTDRINIFLFFVIFFVAILVYIERTRRGHPVYIRPIAGLKALEEAVGRATEMGKPVFFMPGIDEANNIQTLYGMVILQHVTRLVARYETPLIVAVGKAFVVPLAQETVRQGYLDAGRPELYKPDIVRYFSDEQFATVTAVAGVFQREKPATNLYFGSFYAESLILAENGFLTGAIQIAGTGNVHQLPFFVVACDYALVGEEFFAVSAYLSNEPKLLGSLKAMDMCKAVAILILTVGFLAATVNVGAGEAIARWLQVL